MRNTNSLKQNHSSFPAPRSRHRDGTEKLQRLSTDDVVVARLKLSRANFGAQASVRHCCSILLPVTPKRSTPIHRLALSETPPVQTLLLPNRHYNQHVPTSLLPPTARELIIKLQQTPHAVLCNGLARTRTKCMLLLIRRLDHPKTLIGHTLSQDVGLHVDAALGVGTGYLPGASRPLVISLLHNRSTHIAIPKEKL